MIPVFPRYQGRAEGQERPDRRHRQRPIDRLGMRKAFRALGADLAVTYLNERAKKHVEPLAQALEAPIFMPMDVMVEGQTEQVFEQIEKEWGQLDFLLHSIAFSPKEALHGRVVDVGRDGFLKTMDVSCWSFMRMAHLAEPFDEEWRNAVHDDLLRQPDGGEELQYHGGGKGCARSRSALHCGRAWPEGIRVHAISPGRWRRARRRGFRNSTN